MARGSQCVTSGRKIAPASRRRRPPRAMPAAQALTGRKPACRLGRQAWTAPCGCGFARRLDGAAGAALCPSLALLAAHAPAVRLRPPRWRAVPQKLPRVWPAAALSPTPRAMGARGPLGEGVAFGEPRAIAGAGLRPPTTTAALGRGLLPCLRLPTGALRQCPHRRRLPPGPRRGLGRSALNGQPPLRGSPKHGPVFPSALQGKARPLTRQSASVARRRVMVS